MPDPTVAADVFPVALVMKQPDLGTAIMLLAGGAVMFFLAGYGCGFRAERGWRRAAVPVAWQMLRDYQGPASHLPRPGARPAGRRLSHPAVEDRAGLGRCSAGASCRHAEPPELPAREADRLHLHNARRGVRHGRRPGPAGLYSCRSSMPAIARRAAAFGRCSASGSRSTSSSARSSIQRWRWG